MENERREPECVRCGETFENETERTMHVIRKRCPEIDSEDDVESADSVHAIESLVNDIVEDETDG